MAHTIRSAPKDTLRKLLLYGDIGRIAMRVPYDYHYVARVIRGDANNELIWKETVNFLEEQDDRSLSRRIERAIKLVEAAA